MKVIVQHNDEGRFIDIEEFPSTRDAVQWFRDRKGDLAVGEYRIVSVIRSDIRVSNPKTVTTVEVDLGEPTVKRPRKGKE